MPPFAVSESKKREIDSIDWNFATSLENSFRSSFSAAKDLARISLLGLTPGTSLQTSALMLEQKKPQVPSLHRLVSRYRPTKLPSAVDNCLAKIPKVVQSTVGSQALDSGQIHAQMTLLRRWFAHPISPWRFLISTWLPLFDNSALWQREHGKRERIVASIGIAGSWILCSGPMERVALRRGVGQDPFKKSGRFTTQLSAHQKL
ncbi:hypothetical protein J3F84DRAFT_60256 [Trichoderma pleuroticola]